MGEANDLAKVEELLIDDIDVTGCSKDLETSVVLANYLPDGITLAENTEEVMVKVIVEEVKEAVLGMDADEINIVGKEEGYNYVFKDESKYSLKVRGLKADLEALKVTNLIPSIDVTGYGPGTYTFTVNLREIKGIQILEEITVELEIVQAE